MDTIQRLQPLDFVFILLWGLIVAWGVQSGVIRQLILFVVAYASFVLASQLYRPAGAALAYAFGTGILPQLQFIAYATTFVLAVVGAGWASIAFYPQTRLVGRRRLDGFLGGLVGALWASVLIVSLVTVLRLFSATFWPGQEGAISAVDAQVRRSQVPPALQAGFGPVWQIMVPWFPDKVGANIPR